MDHIVKMSRRKREITHVPGLKAEPGKSAELRKTAPELFRMTRKNRNRHIRNRMAGEIIQNAFSEKAGSPGQKDAFSS